MTKKIKIYSSDEKFTVSDLSELLYNINNIYKILVLIKEHKEKNLYYYYRIKLSDEKALFVEKITKQSPFHLEISNAISYADILQTLLAIVGIAIGLKALQQGKKDKKSRKVLKEEVVTKLRERRIVVSDELVSEVVKLSKRRIRIEEIHEENYEDTERNH